ncbi:MAG: aldo/keto reductase [Methylacidiphilales bacterium]|nr:aldo/keto reductase [Candidatus Methylacidiphilales bacterium]
MKIASPISRMGLGTSRLASLGSALSRRQATVLLHTAIDHGIRVIDTADTYGSGDSERAIGVALRERPRDDFFLITKAGFTHVALPSFLSPLNQVGKKLLQKVSAAKNFSKPYVLRCLERSLKRLRVDHVDAFLLHEPVAGEPSSQSWEALEQIRARGMSRFTGVSTSDPEVVSQGIASGQVSLVETSVSLAAPHAEEIGRICAGQQVQVIANEVLKPRSALERSGTTWDSIRKHHGVASVSTVHLLIAYAAAQPGVSSVIIGTKSPGHLVENLQALQYSEGRQALFAEMKEAFA